MAHNITEAFLVKSKNVLESIELWSLEIPSKYSPMEMNFYQSLWRNMFDGDSINFYGGILYVSF
ncbi:MAG: hypothetical protein R3Y53_08870 [Bacillota bacterium]